MKARIVGGEFDGVEFEVSDATIDNIKKVGKYSDIKEYCRKNYVFSNYKASFVEINGGNYARVPLPSANTRWTFAAFKWIKEFHKHFKGIHHCFPEHRSNLDCANYLWIRIS